MTPLVLGYFESQQQTCTVPPPRIFQSSDSTGAKVDIHAMHLNKSTAKTAKVVINGCFSALVASLRQTE